MKESPLFTRSYDFARWLLPLTAKFPREHRFVLARSLQERALGFHEALIDAATGSDRKGYLESADRLLAKLRFHLRLCHDLKLLSTGQYEHGARMLEEMGRMLGAWLKKQAARERV